MGIAVLYIFFVFGVIGAFKGCDGVMELEIGPESYFKLFFFKLVVVGGWERERALIETTIKEFLLSVLVCALSVSHFSLGGFFKGARGGLLG